MDQTYHYRPEKKWQEHAAPEPESKALFYTEIRQHGAVAHSIRFVLKTQCQHCLPVHEILEIYFDPTEGIRLFFRSATVMIKGRHLEILYRLLSERRIIEIREFSEESSVFFEKEILFISAIHYESEHLLKAGL
ncbi:MAG: hypothetical protein MI974_12850 [Chitinophagales bacterium]|nr:hypothetical protein [Chitinophagales bacterium]